MATTGSGCSASGLDDIPEPDYDHLSFAYFSDDDDDYYYPKKPGNNGKNSAKEPREPSDPPYILGTLIVRVVAARDLTPARGGGGLGNFFFGGGKGGTANPYASVKFGTSTQRTSDLYDTLDPVWPRGETMFMDVSLPLSKTMHADTTATTTNPTTKGTPDVVWNGSDSSENSDRMEDSNPIPDIRPKDPPSSNLSLAHAGPNPKNHIDSVGELEIPQPILTLAVFSASEVGKSHKSIHGSNSRYPNKKGFSGDSDDEFLGMASVDLTTLLTGKRPIVDAWLPLQGGTDGSVRITCEYETADTPPEKGDLVRFTRFCHNADLSPLGAGRTYPVQEIIDRDHVLLSYTSPEGWVSSFMVHRFMVLCVERHHGTAVEVCRDEIQSITERLSHSPLVGTVTQTAEQLQEEGLFGVGANVVEGSAGLLSRWLEGGLDTAVKDLAFATNWDGRFNPGLDGRDSTTHPTETNEGDNRDSGEPEAGEEEESPKKEEPPIILPEPAPKSSDEKEALPGMPSCPITGEPMIDPVVAADGHTYERAAIARWLQTSDMSPLTGSILHHKELVPNYGLLSSLQEQADANRKKAPPKAAPKPPPATKAEPKPAPIVGPGVATAEVPDAEPAPSESDADPVTAAEAAAQPAGAPESPPPPNDVPDAAEPFAEAAPTTDPKELDEAAAKDGEVAEANVDGQEDASADGKEDRKTEAVGEEENSSTGDDEDKEVSSLNAHGASTSSKPGPSEQESQD